MSLNDRLAAYFKSRPNTWIDGRELSKVAGAYAWRSRCSELRTQRGFTIENRQRVVKTHSHDCIYLDGLGPCQCGKSAKFTISEYRYRVSEPEQLPLSDQWSVGV